MLLVLTTLILGNIVYFLHFVRSRITVAEMSEHSPDGHSHECDDEDSHGHSHGNHGHSHANHGHGHSHDSHGHSHDGMPCAGHHGEGSSNNKLLNVDEV